MLMRIVSVLFPNYYRRVWNEEFIKHFEPNREQLYKEFPDHQHIVDEAMERGYRNNLK